LHYESLNRSALIPEKWVVSNLICSLVPAL
jgi:hypothetical protein